MEMAEATSNCSERLFSLDSDDSSYIQHADFLNGLKTQERDYYKNLFTPNTLSETSEYEDSQSQCSDIPKTSNNPGSILDPNSSSPINRKLPNQKFVFDNLIKNLENIGQPKTCTNVSNFFKSMPGNATSTSNHSNIQAVLELEDTSMESETIPRHPHEESSKNNINQMTTKPESRNRIQTTGKNPSPNSHLSEISSISKNDSQIQTFHDKLSSSEQEQYSISSNHNFSFETNTPTFQFDFNPLQQKEEVINSIPLDTEPPIPQSLPKDKHNQYIKTSELPNDIVNNLLGFNQPLPKIMEPESSPSLHTDTIATFNVQNKFDHVMAAELMMKENITFLALQEPYATQHEHNTSWNAYTKSELQAARIDCFESQYQIILIDTWKWGGKSICNFAAYLNGRITSTAFEFGDGKKLGIITIYNSSAEVHNNEDHGINGKIINIYDEITDKWKSQFPDIDVVIIGDFQETCSTSSQDNIGKFRKEKNLLGLLSHIEDTHVSFIRESLDDSKKYVTRFGTSGARGIDHIMVHQNPNIQELFSSPKIRRKEGNTYFPSDHALLTCDYLRRDKNNNEDGISKMKFDYSKISRIKLKNSGENGRNISLDDKQFKDSEMFRSQAKLYSNLQKVTNNSSDLSNYHLTEIEDRLDGLSKDLWQCGMEQQVDGRKNKLVEITENQATELSYAYRKFNFAIQEVMDTLKLARPKDNLEAAGKTRGRLRKGKGFRLFKNLPISTKLRYLRHGIKTKLKLIQKAQIWLREFKVNNDEKIDQYNEEEFWQIRDEIVKTNSISNQAKIIEQKLDSECLERESHMNAIKYNLMKQKQNSRGANDNSQSDSSILNPSIDSEKFVASNLSCIHKNIASSVTNWKVPLTEFLESPNFFANNNSWNAMYEQLEESEKQIRNLISRITNMQTRYRKSTLHYFLNVNTINSFTQKVLQKERSAPATHTIIWDEVQQSYRPCKNEIEELQATRNFHGKWMSDSKAKENCAFASVIRKGRLGPRGIKLTPDRKITMDDIPALVHNGHKLSRKIKKKAFIKAHNKFTARLFRAPKRPRKEFFYPFYLNGNHETMNKSKLVESKLWKSLTNIPSKARHDGYHIAILGRFDSRWRNILLKFIEIMLIMRYIPADMKKIARYPIPKPGKKNEYRPISLCDDLYCFINGIITQITSDAIEKSKLLHEGITSYRKGKSCATLVTIEQCFREDCIEGNQPTVQIDEDEEKFFDRVCLEIILAVMKINGFPDDGFIELKACMMGEKLVEIVTSKGTVHAIFQCGLEQGNPDSPTIANLVITMKHDIWRTVSDQAKHIFERNNGGRCDRYEFNIKDPDDLKNFLYMIGYCDDNSKFISASNENDLIFLVRYYIQLAGNLSMATKIGRKSSKCDVHFFNISAKFAINLQKCWSTAWSFIHDAPIQEQVPYKIFLQQEEMVKFYELVNFNDLSEDEKEKWNDIIKPKAHKHLGLQATLRGDTSLSSIKTIEKMHNRLSQLNLQRMDPPAQRKCANMLISSMHSFVPLQSNHDQIELTRLDESLIHHIRTKNGISSTDCKHRIFIPEAKGGLGFLSNLEIDIISVARELEITLNGGGLDSATLRGRTLAIMGYDEVLDDEIVNHVMQAIFKLGRYGIHLRDGRDDIINDILRILAIQQKGFSVGDPFFKGGNGAHLGYGKEKLLQFSFGNTLHRLLRHMKNNKWDTDNYTAELSKTCKTPVETILAARDEAGNIRYEQFDETFSYREWTNFRHIIVESNLSKNSKDWSDHRISNNASTLSQPRWTWSHQHLFQFAESEHSIDWTSYIIRQKEKTSINYSFSTYTTYGKIMNFLYERGSPIIIATDGSHDPYVDTTKHSNTSSALTICALDIRSLESIESQEWTHRPMIPLLCRSALLPNKVGHSKSDIAHGECFAIVMEELLFNPLIPRVVIMDSEAVRNQIINVRQTCNEDIDRAYVRTQAGGISKSFISLIRKRFSIAYSSKVQSPITPSLQWIIDTFTKRNEKFLEIAEQWTTSKINAAMGEEQEIEMAGWPEDYLDGNSRRAIIQVNSHQLDCTGTRFKQSPKFAYPTPNLAIANANRHADVGADLALQVARLDSTRTHNSRIFTIPPSNLNYFLTIGGNSLDRHVSDNIRRALDNEREKRIKSKPTQGLLWRILNHTTTKWNVIRLHPGLYRSLLGLSGTHTRCMYKSAPYRTGCLLNHLETIDDKEQREAITNSSIQNQISILSKCPVCQQSNMCSHKGNRRHAFLSCNHIKLARFKQKMNNMIGNRMYLFVQELKEIMEWDKVEHLIKTVNSELLLLQKEQTGRLTRLPIENNNTYLPVMEILRKHATKSIQDAIENIPSAFFTHLLGITPEASF